MALVCKGKSIRCSLGFHAILKWSGRELLQASEAFNYHRNLDYVFNTVAICSPDGLQGGMTQYCHILGILLR